ncbi:zinc-binding dehydrogenase [Inquilinus limosus]|uniref:quinone oxidoreductase family protein n=1 Tax=Inquilinus limosus TaxID=171674 RepID=UPI003F168431
MKAVVFDRIGLPTEVLYLADMPVPEIGPGEALVRMVAASINPGDFLFVQNLYPEPKKPRFPRQIAGNHGAGVIERAGPGVALPPGTLVAFSHEKTWAEYAAVPAEYLIPLPPDMPAEKAGQLMNPITAWDLVMECGVGAGQWLAVTAGYSTISTLVLQFARRRGIRTVAIVRRLRADLDLPGLGAEAVIDLSRPDLDLRAEVTAITGGTGLHGVVDNVGGPATGELIRSLGFGGRVVINGGMSEERFTLHNFDVLLNGVSIQPSVYRYFFGPPPPEDAALLREVIEAFARPEIRVPLGGVHPLADAERAIAESWARPGDGKRIFRM